MIEFRVCWNASSNISFNGETDWIEELDDTSAEDLEASLSAGAGGISAGLELALEGSGFDWWVEIRER
jgi:FKBP-type peptidyl-prolyl cis-trans isomerase 2